MNPGRHALPLFLGVSLAAHAAVLLYLPDPPTRSARPLGDAGLQITLTRISGAAPAQATPADPAPQATPPPSRPVASRAQTRPAPRHRPAIADSADAPDTVHAGNPAQPATAPETRIAAGSALLAQLRDAMQPYFHYPLLARRRGWEGTVQVGLRISASGEISRVRIVRTSDHEILDRAALDCLNRMRRMPGALAWLDGHDSDIVLPVEYRLTDG
jgi:protein TonB